MKTARIVKPSIGLAAILVVSLGCTSSKPSPSPASAIADTHVPSDYFLDYLAKVSSESICQRESFVQCMGISAADCRQDFGAASSRCREQFSATVHRLSRPPRKRSDMSVVSLSALGTAWCSTQATPPKNFEAALGDAHSVVGRLAHACCLTRRCS